MAINVRERVKAQREKVNYANAIRTGRAEASEKMAQLRMKYGKDLDGHREARLRLITAMGSMFELNFNLYSPMIFEKFFELIDRELEA